MSEKTNGNHTNGSAAHAAPSTQFGVGPSFKEEPAKLPKANREGIKQTFQQLGQWIHASEQPYPTQTGHGTFTVGKKPTLKQDLKTLSMKGMVQVASQTGNPY